MNQSAELYLLSPLAWTHAQDLLARESEMIEKGVGKKKRREYLERECERLQELSEVSLTETLDEFIADLKRQDVIVGSEDMRARFDRYGFIGTPRTVRNINRRLGNEDVGLDITTILAGIHILGEDEVFAATANRAFAPFFDTLFAHPAYAEGEAAFNVLQGERLLPSEKDRQAKALAVDMITKALEGFETLHIESKRVEAYLRGRLLDIELADIMVAILTTGGLATVESVMRESVDVQLDQYWSVLWHALDPRMTELGGWSDEADDDNEENDVEADSTSTQRTATAQSPSTRTDAPMTSAAHASPLLSLEQTRSILNVSRTTVYRLVRDGALEKVSVRGRVHVTRASVDKYIASETTKAG